jgi:hypothetical protein
VGAHTALHPKQPITDRREAGDRRNASRHFRSAELRGEKHSTAVDLHTITFDFDLNIELTQLSGIENTPLLLRHALLEKRKGHRPIKRPRIEMPKT